MLRYFHKQQYNVMHWPIPKNVFKQILNKIIFTIINSSLNPSLWGLGLPCYLWRYQDSSHVRVLRSPEGENPPNLDTFGVVEHDTRNNPHIDIANTNFDRQILRMNSDLSCIRNWWQLLFDVCWIENLLLWDRTDVQFALLWSITLNSYPKKLYFLL